MKRFFILVCIIIVISCKKETNNNLPITERTNQVILKYAQGFSIDTYESYSVLHIKNPWPDSDNTFKYALIKEKNAAKITLNKNEFDGIIITPVKEIVVSSTTHIPALELLEEEKTLVGFPGTKYVSSQKTRNLIDNGVIRELGKNESINTEVLLELKPELIIGFGVDGVNKTFETIQKSGIPVIYNGDWVEASPLAKAEWIKFFAALYNKEKRADSIFDDIETTYMDAKQLAGSVLKKPTVLSGAMHKDLWYLPKGSSPEGQLLKDANVNYLWSDTKGNGSLALSFETVYNKAKNADYWLSPSYYDTLDAIIKANEHYTQFDAFKNKKVYSFTNTTGKTGGVLYYELGSARPDLVLKDLIKICHPELLENYEPFFFKALE